MTSPAEPASWLEWVRAQDPAMFEAFSQYIGAVHEMDSLPARQREVIQFAVSAALRVRSSSKAHAQRALKHGSTIQELFHALALASLSSGLPTAVQGVQVLSELQREST